MKLQISTLLLVLGLQELVSASPIPENDSHSLEARDDFSSLVGEVVSELSDVFSIADGDNLEGLIEEYASKLVSEIGDKAPSVVSEFAAAHSTIPDSSGAIESIIASATDLPTSSAYSAVSTTSQAQSETSPAHTSTPSTQNTSKTASATASSQPTSGGHSGRGTFYTPDLGACGKTNTESELVVAISCKMYEDNNKSDDDVSSLCDKEITADYKGKSVSVKVVDCCESCSYYDLDFSPTAFSKLADKDIGEIAINWNWS